MAIHILVTDKTLAAEREEMCAHYVGAKVILLKSSVEKTTELNELIPYDTLVVYGISHFKSIYGMISLLHFVTNKKITLIQFRDKRTIPGGMNVSEFLEFIKSEEEVMRHLWKRGVVKKEREPRAKYLTYEGVKRVAQFMEEGLTQQEMASRMGCSLGTIKLAVGRVRTEVLERREKRDLKKEQMQQKFREAMKIAYRKEFL